MLHGALRYLPFVLVAAVALEPSRLHAQAPGTSRWADSAVKLIDQGIATGKPEALDNAIALMDRVLTVTPKDGVILHYKGYALYRKSSLMMGMGAKEDEVKVVLEEADDVLAQSSALLKWPETPALRASVTGQLIGVSGMLSGMRLGPKADGLMDDAVALGPNNPRVFMLRGVSSLYKPRMFGGGADKAERDIRKAIELFATDKPEPPAPSWGQAEAWAWLGQVYAEEKKLDEARAAYQKALELQPDFGWVKDQLLPALDRIKR
ncbi:MAG: tetratricopeptide repeat protein [Gemmatimonadaceae bacterium]